MRFDAYSALCSVTAFQRRSTGRRSSREFESSITPLFLCHELRWPNLMWSHHWLATFLSSSRHFSCSLELSIFYFVVYVSPLRADISFSGPCAAMISCCFRVCVRSYCNIRQCGQVECVLFQHCASLHCCVETRCKELPAPPTPTLLKCNLLVQGLTCSMYKNTQTH